MFKKAAELGFTDDIVGDGADELFGGYPFMLGYEDNPAEWRENVIPCVQRGHFRPKNLLVCMT